MNILVGRIVKQMKIGACLLPFSHGSFLLDDKQHWLHNHESSHRLSLNSHVFKKIKKID